jgi:DNA-3-methyladenine glycosylase
MIPNDLAILSRDFYEPAADVVAPALLGHFLLRQTSKGWCGGLIVETEAYLSNDPACHAYTRETARNRAMWGAHGHAYVYLIYGVYHCFNAVCRPQGVAEAVLVRALQPTVGLDWMHSHRPDVNQRSLTNGPGKLCTAMAIDRTLDGSDLCDATSPIVIAANPQQPDFVQQNGPMVTTTRVGIKQAADWPLRYYLDGSGWVSQRVKK